MSTNDSALQLLGVPPDLKPHKTFRIAVSEDILLTRLEVDIVDTPHFQRLRRLKQLGTSFLVYPSAQHTRFEHSLGSVHMAETMMRLIEQNDHTNEEAKKISDEQRQVVRLVALLHDIGNIPFGHTLEDETNVVQTNQEDTNRYDMFIGAGTGIGKKLLPGLGHDRYNLLRRILVTKKNEIPKLEEHAFIHDIVKNTVCSDLLDYLQRDAYFCSLNLGFGNRFLRFMHLVKREEFLGKERFITRRLAIKLWKESDNRPRPALLSEPMQLLQARYHLGERVYFHHAKIISSAMLAKAVYHAMRTGQPKLEDKDLYEMGDDELIETLCKRKAEDSLTASLAVKLKERRLFIRFYTLGRGDIEVEKKRDVMGELTRSYHKDADQRAKKERELADLCGMDPGSVIIYCPDPTMSLKVPEMLVSWKDDVIPFQQIDDPLYRGKIDAVLSSHRQLWQLQVFMDPKYKDDEVKRGLLERWCRYTFEGGLRRRPNFKSLIKETIVDVAGEDAYRYTTRELEEAAKYMASPARNENVSRSLLRDYVKRNFKSRGQGSTD